MAKLKSENIKYVTTEGEDATVSIGWEVNDDGVFSAIIPDWIVDIVKAQAPGLMRGDSTGVGISFGVKNWRLSALEKTKISNIIHAAMRAYSAPVITEEQVIRYTWDAQAGFVTDDTGTIAQNGYVFEKMTGRSYRDDPAVTWAKLRNEVHATKPANGGFNIRLAAYVYDKKTTTRGASVKVEYSRAHDGHFSSELDNPIHMLNQFAHQGGIDHKGKPMQSWGGGFNSCLVEEMPYTPEAAWFFVNALKGMCRMAKTMNDFFVDKEALALAIATGKGPLMIGGGQ